MNYKRKFQEAPLPLDLQKFFPEIKYEIEQRFNDGYATCTFAVYKILKKFPKYRDKFKVVDGEYKGYAHWYIIYANSWIIDFGNNIWDKSIKTGEIYPLTVKYPNKNYTKDEILTVSEYFKYYPTIKAL